MSYANDWRIRDGTDLAALLKGYVRELLKPVGISFLTWETSGVRYQKTAEAMSKTWGSMVADAGVSFDLPQLQTDAQKEAYLRNRMRPDSRQSDIRRVYRKARAAASDKKKRTFVIFLNSFWWEGTRAVGHAQFIFIDYRKKKQVFFDPHGVGVRSFFKEFCRVPAIVPGHTNVPPDEALGYRLQGHMEASIEEEQCGTCGLTSLLTLLCCRRFNYWHIPTITKAIHDAFPSEIEAATIMQSLIYLYESRVLTLNIHQGNLTLDQKKQLFSTLFPDEERCRVYSDSSGKFCSRKACRMGDALSLCWQHRHYLQAPYNSSKKCAAPFRE